MSGEAELGAGSVDQFARIDLVSNHTVFRDPACYHALLRQQPLSIETFSSFIHEATHHWCFTSPVGTALSFLYLSAAKQTLRVLERRSGNIDQALDDLCTFDIAVRFLRPLNEGLAQFAEYDVRPSETADLASPPLLGTLGHLFRMRDRIDFDAADWREKSYTFQDDLVKWRVSRRTIDRKSELLLQPLDSESSAYLLGYLTIKQLWKNAMRFYEELASADVFLIFARKLIFGDYALVEALLDRKKRPQARAIEFARLLHARLQTIRMMPFAEETPWSELEKMLAMPPRETLKGLNLADPVPFAALDTTKAVKRGLRLYRERFREVADLELFQQLEPFGEVPPDLFFDIVRERYLMWMGDVTARWESTGRNIGRVKVDDTVLYDNFAVPKSGDEGLDVLRLDLYIDLYRGFQATTVGSERAGVFGLAVDASIPEATREEMFSARLDRVRIVRWTGIFQQLMAKVIGRTNYRKAMAKFWTAPMRKLLMQTYIGFAVDFQTKAKRLLLKEGFSGVLENDPDLVRNVAAISLGASVELSPEGLVSMSDVPLDPEGTIRRVASLWPIAGFPLAAIRRDGFLSSAV